ncbi:MAG: prolyl oligopeptidase family serine peptidase, partial [Anaerolineae bacterium]|nr:prolyl oligopeptidase family serine peptidase [Anaerolineae bacterium]
GESGDPAAPDIGLGGTQDGAIAAMTLLYESPAAEYYRITYYSDGLRINGFLGMPKGDGPFPAVIYNRGGAWESGKIVGYEMVPFAESGYVVAASQYRGNDGSEGLETFGWNDVHDVTNLIVLLQSLPKVDPWRIGMMGGSRGGMMTYMAIKNETLTGQNRIRAAVTVGGLSDLVAWEQQTPDIAEEIYMAVIGSMPSQNPAPFIERSAVYWSDLITVPLLLLHGGADYIVPVDQSQKLHDLIRAAGGSVQLIVFPGDSHELGGQAGGFRMAIDFFGPFLSQDGADRRYESHEDAIDESIRWFALNQ